MALYVPVNVGCRSTCVCSPAFALSTIVLTLRADNANPRGTSPLTTTGKFEDAIVSPFCPSVHLRLSSDDAVHLVELHARKRTLAAHAFRSR